MPKLMRLICLVLVSFTLSPAQTGKVIHGTITDAQTGEILPAANIQIEKTYRGTITNNSGEYILELEQLPATILISYIGYASRKFTVSENSVDELNIRMEPVVYELEPILVTDEDPAIRIMREVIKRKQQWRAKLKTYIADAYTRQVLENDTSIVTITESISTAFWDKEKGSREVIRSRRQTSNISADENFAAVSYVANFYDDDIEIIGFKVIGPTHPDALKHYHFKLEGRRYLDDKVVYDISLWPKSKLQTAFVGRIAVLDEEFAMIETDLRPGESILFPPPIQELNIAYKQQFSNFGKDFWLPVDVRMDGTIKIGFFGLQFPEIIYHQISRITNYQVNASLPDSLYKKEEVLQVDSASVSDDSVFASESEVIPLSKIEAAAYQKIDSTMTLEKAFKPSGFLARFVEVEDGSGDAKQKGKGIFKYISPAPRVWYNRVDGAHLGAKLENKGSERFKVYINGGYKFDLKRWAYGGGFKWRPGKQQYLFLEGDYQVGTDPRYRSANYSLTLNSVLPLAGYEDYFDYYWNERFQAKVRYRLQKLQTSLTVGLNAEKHTSLEKTTDYSLFKRNYIQRPNPAIPEGDLRSLEFTISYGESYVPFGVVGQQRASFHVEHSSPDIFSSDFSFTRYDVTLDWRVNTFFTRRLLPNSLDIRLIAGNSGGELPPQRFRIVDGSFYPFKPFGALRTLTGIPYEGEKYFAVFWEHNFRTLPLEILGLRGWAKKGISFIVHGAHTRTWFKDETLQRLEYTPRIADEFHHELGVSINNLLQILRLDAAWRLNTGAFYMGVGFARFF
jgi:hypothetical protein